MDKYTKFILTTIALCLIGINFQLFKDDIISTAHAIESHTHSSFEILGRVFIFKMLYIFRVSGK